MEIQKDLAENENPAIEEAKACFNDSWASCLQESSSSSSNRAETGKRNILKDENAKEKKARVQDEKSAKQEALLAKMNPAQKREHALNKGKDVFVARAKKVFAIVSKAENEADHAAISLGKLLSEKKVEYVSDKLVKELSNMNKSMGEFKAKCTKMISECTLMDAVEFDKQNRNS